MGKKRAKIKTFNEHIVTIKAKRHQNSVEFHYLGTPGVAENFINDKKIGAAFKGAFEPRYKREVKEFKPSLGQNSARCDESSTSSTVPLGEALEIIAEGNAGQNGQ